MSVTVKLGNTTYTLVSTPITITTATDTTVVAAPTDSKIIVFGYTLVGANTVTWKSASTGISGPMTFTVGLTVSAGMVPVLECVAAQALVLITADAADIGGHVVYAIISDT